MDGHRLNNIGENHIKHIDSQLEKILNHLQNLERRLDKQETKTAELGKYVSEINQNLHNLDLNVDEINTNIDILDERVEKITAENEGFRADFKYSKDEINRLVKSFHNLEEQKAVQILTPYEKTVEQNRLWRLYSNNYRVNSVANNDNILKQLALNISVRAAADKRD